MANGTIGISQINVLTTSGTGTLSIVPPATNTNRTLTLPDGTGTIVANGVNGSLVSGTAVASTSGTSIDFTGIPSWVKRITVMFQGVSANGTSVIQIQIGDSGGVETTGYLGAAGYIQNASSTGCASFTSGFAITSAINATSVYHGSMIITLLGSNAWVANGAFARSDVAVQNFGQGSKALSDTLTQVRITTVNGTDTFDAGTINILYE
jgi:hypothetical protein